MNINKEKRMGINMGINLDKLEHIVTKLTRYLLIYGMVLMLILVFTQVITRYFISNTPFFIEEASRGLLIWISFLGSSLALRQGKHIGVEFFVNKLPVKIRPPVIYLAILFMLVFLVFFLYASGKYSINQMGLPSATLPFSMFWFYLALPVGSLLMIFQLIFLIKKGVNK